MVVTLLQTPDKSRNLSRGSSNASSIADALSLYTEGSGAFSENNPLVRDDVVREGDGDENADLPTQGMLTYLVPAK